jgi:regulatory protein
MTAAPLPSDGPDRPRGRSGGDDDVGRTDPDGDGPPVPSGAEGDGDARRGPVGGEESSADRAVRLADLAAAISRIGPDGTDRSAPAGRPSRGAGLATERTIRPRGRAGGDLAGGRRVVTGPPPEDPLGPANDAPGDPESVAKAICLRLLTGAARSRADLARALRRREIPDGAAERVLDRLTDVGLIDDAAYAEAFVASKHRDRGLGRAALRTELRRKGIDPGIADRAVDAVDGHAERRRAADLVARRLDSAVFAGLPAARRRLLGLLARRGYPASVAAAVVDDALRGFSDPTTLEPGDDSVAAGWDDAET